MTGKGLKSRMSDECLMKQKTVISFYVVYQAVMRKFTLAGKSSVLLESFFKLIYQETVIRAQLFCCHTFGRIIFRLGLSPMARWPCASCSTMCCARLCRSLVEELSVIYASTYAECIDRDSFWLTLCLV